MWQEFECAQRVEHNEQTLGGLRFQWHEFECAQRVKYNKQTLGGLRFQWHKFECVQRVEHFEQTAANIDCYLRSIDGYEATNVDRRLAFIFLHSNSSWISI